MNGAAAARLKGLRAGLRRVWRESRENVWFGSVLEAEFAYLRRRREGGTPVKAVKHTLVGLALSGGGIRSATTNLGMLQAMSRLGILPMVDYLCTVSGGGYIGSCLSTLLSLQRPAAPGALPRILRAGGQPMFTTAWPTFPFNPDNLPGGAAQIRHIRTHGSFLVTRKGLLKRETMRSVGNLLSGTMYHLTLVFLALAAAALLYLSMLFSYIPSIDTALRGLSDPVPRYATAYELRTEGSTQPVRAAGIAQGPVMVPGAPRQFSQATEFVYPGLFDIIQAKFRTVADQLWNAGRDELDVVGYTAAFGCAVALGSFLFLRLFSTRWRIRVTPKVGESHEDAEAVLVLQVAAYGSLLLIVWWLVRTLWLFQTPLWLLLPVVLVGTLRMTTWLIHLGLPRFGQMWSRHTRSLWGAYQAMASYALWTTVLLAVFPVAIYTLREYAAWVGASGVVSLAVARAVTFRRGPDAKKRPLATSLLRVVLAVAIAAGILFVLIAICVAVIGLSPDARTVAWAGTAAAAVVLVLGVTGDANRLSPHYFYRDRLAEAYLYTDQRERQRQVLQTMRDNIELPLKDLHYEDDGGRQPPAATTAPYHLISCAINLAASRDLTRKDRKSGYWVFSRLFCGSIHTRFRQTSRYHQGDVKVARAITISGAAASSGVGAGTFFAQAFATVLFNLRLGYWMENPRSGDRRWWRNLHFWPCWLWREMTMDTHERNAMINLSDGGHTGDNVGIYPLLQRQCRLIIACDAEADPNIGFGSFTEALRHAYIDLGIDVDIDLTMVRPDPETGMSRSHVAVGLIRYPQENPRRPRRIGYLLYLKNSLTGDEPEPVLNYKSTHPAFPHESTVDQFFDDAQFESYRALGHHIAEQAFATWARGGAFQAWHAAQRPAPRATV
jgi:hypothetical protein